MVTWGIRKIQSIKSHFIYILTKYTKSKLKHENINVTNLGGGRDGGGGAQFMQPIGWRVNENA